MMPIARLRKVAKKGRCADLGQVLTKGHVPGPVEAVLYGPMPVHEPEEVLNGCVGGSEVGDGNVKLIWPHCDGLIWPHLGTCSKPPGPTSASSTT